MTSPDTKKVLAYIREETKLSGVHLYPIGIEELASDLSINQSVIDDIIRFLESKKILERCGIGNDCVRLI